MKQPFILLLIIVLIQSCAVVKQPTGGPMDKIAPKLLSQTTKDSSVNFKGGIVSFSFDERLDIKGLQISTFPLMKNIPEVTLNKRKVNLNIPDSLLEKNTTYKISFGNSIKDIYEGTPISGLDFTFSTGPYLDSLSLFGKVYNAQNGMPDTEAVVVLYTQFTKDSDIAVNRPLYTIKPNADGFFKFTNLPKKEYFLFALHDNNKNLLFDLPTEHIGYLPTTVLPFDTFNKKSTIILRTFPAFDTLKNNIKQNRRRENTFEINVDTTLKTTFDFTKPITISPKNKLTVFNSSKVLLSNGTEIDATALITFDSSINKIIINAELLPDTTYTLTLLDNYGFDTSSTKGNVFKFKTKKKDDYGDLILSFDSTTIFTVPTIVLLVNAEQKIIAKQIFTGKELNFNKLAPGNYTLQLLQDINKNGKWDSGSYWGVKKQPEIVIAYPTLIAVKAKWQNKIKWAPLNK